jgi:hypothetical protein
MPAGATNSGQLFLSQFIRKKGDLQKYWCSENSLRYRIHRSFLCLLEMAYPKKQNRCQTSIRKNKNTSDDGLAIHFFIIINVLKEYA